MKIRTLFTKNFGRKSFLNLISYFIAEKHLAKKSRKHVNEGKRQVAIEAFDYIAYEILLDGVFEKRELETFFSWIKDLNINTHKTIAIDIGANIGNHSLYFSDYYDKVFSFEPSHRIFQILSLNAELVKNIDCFNFGLSDQDQTATLAVNLTSKGGSKIASKDLRGGVITNEGFILDETENVELKRLDTFLPDLEKVGLIKADVEGHEFQALKGAENTIRKNKPIVLVEQHEDSFIEGVSPVINLLRDFGYNNFAFLEKFPRVSGNFLINAIFRPFAALVLGNKTKIQLSDKINPGSYVFIIALPDWFPISNQ